LAIKREYPAVPYSEHEKVLRAIRFFQGKGRKVFARWLERAEYNIPIMKNILREEGVPEELVYLSMIESGFNPKAYSYAHASGPWQFIRSTGKIFGLKVDFWYDERRDIVKSTKAAARYLKRLYLEFDDWYLAMAAYNCGERKVLSHTRKYKTKDFWKLRRLPAQTRNYVPTYLAARAIAENPNEFGFDDIVLKNLAPYDSVLIRECTDLATIAQLVDTTLEYIRELNPAIMRWCTPPSIDSIWIYVPWGKSDEFLAGIEQVPDSAKMSWVRHYIKSGETLKQIAGKYGVTTQAIKDIKSNDIRGNRVIAGEVLLIPIPSQKYQKAWAEQEKKDSHLYPEEGRRTVYTVRKGDTLSGIAKKFGIPLSKLRISNGLGKRNLIRPGQKLIIYDSKKIYTPKTVYQSANPIESKNIPRFHRVKQGESLWTIANKYGLSLKELKEMNNLGSESIIKPGEELVLSHRSAKSQSSDGDSIIYTVKKGDTLWSIASEFGVRISDLKEENGLHGSTVIKVGDKLRIPK
jgi:membrane-bound lytic murein transglycosylase D